MSNDYQSGAARSAQMSHAELIEEMRRHGQYNIDEEKGKPVYGILTVEGAIIKDFADQLDAAHKREITILRDALAEVVASIEVRFPVIEYALDRKPYLDAKKILEQYKEEAK